MQQVEEQGITLYPSLDTNFLFKLIDYLPFKNFVIIDRSCSPVMLHPGTNGPDAAVFRDNYMDPTSIGYNYSELNDTGYGRKHKYTNKKYKYKSKGKTGRFKRFIKPNKIKPTKYIGV